MERRESINGNRGARFSRIRCLDFSGRNMFGPVRGPWPGRQLERLGGATSRHNHTAGLRAGRITRGPPLPMAGGQRSFGLSPKAFTLPWSRRPPAGGRPRRSPRRWRIHHSAISARRPPDRRAASRESDPSYSVRGSISCRASTCALWATNAPSPSGGAKRATHVFLRRAGVTIASPLNAKKVRGNVTRISPTDAQDRTVS